MIQEAVLFSLSQTDFFDHRTFYGGTALQFFHGLERFPEAIDFSLRKRDPAFKLDRYLDTVKRTLLSFDLEADIAIKEKRKLSHTVSIPEKQYGHSSGTDLCTGVNHTNNNSQRTHQDQT